MSLLERRPALRWLVPVVAALVLVLGGAGIGSLAANAGGSLPQRSAAQLLVDAQKARPAGLSGTIVQTSDLGLPSLPSSGGPNDSSSFSSLVTGSHTMKVWYAGPNRVRLVLMGQLGESDVVRNGTDLWTWSSQTKSATHRTVPSTDQQPSLPTGTTPQAVADQVLKAVTPTTKVTTADSVTVAGRPAYELMLQPRDASSLVGSVRLAIDGKTHVPTRVQVFAKGKDTPAFEVGFTSLDTSTPSSSVFAFNPPPGTKVTEGGAQKEQQHAPSAGATSAAKPHVVGSGWTSVLVASAPSGLGRGSGSGELAAVLKKLPTVSGTWGSGRLLSTPLFSAVLTDDGRVAVGAVAPDALTAALQK